MILKDHGKRRKHMVCYSQSLARSGLFEDACGWFLLVISALSLPAAFCVFTPRMAFSFSRCSAAASIFSRLSSYPGPPPPGLARVLVFLSPPSSGVDPQQPMILEMQRRELCGFFCKFEVTALALGFRKKGDDHGGSDNNRML
mmetsp:Transcript_696/g.1454  ORF Transcript_696/g.1454 Transcript_696/m.1454 type:complete len:143 (+) Transcript_696:142-570(+)